MESIEKKIDKIQLKKKEEEAQLTTCVKAILNIEAMLPLGRLALEVHEKNLEDLKNIQSRYDDIKGLESVDLNEETQSKKVCKELEASITALIPGSFDGLDEKVELIEKEVRSIWNSVRELETELGGWKFSRDLWKSSIAHLQATKSQADADIQAAKKAFTPLWRMPSAVWTYIFGLCVYEELSDYLSSGQYTPLRSVPLVLSQVCRFWRITVHQEPALWKSVTAHFSTYWSVEKHEFFAESIGKARFGSNMLVNLSQSLTWGSSYYNRNGQYISGIQPNELTVLKNKPYSIHFDMQDDRAQYTQNANSFPFRHPVSLTLSSRNPMAYNCIFSFLPSYNTIKSLKVINDYPQVLQVTELASILPQLESLTIHVKRFPAEFQLDNFLSENLQELYLRHDDGGALPQLTNHWRLPNLKVLGLTSSGLNLLERTQLKKLESLILYGTNGIEDVHIVAGNNPGKAYGRILHLTLEDWKSEGPYGAVPIFTELAMVMTQLCTVKFAGCFVDGSTLTEFVQSSLGEGGMSLNKLEEIFIRDTTGITRDDCESLASLVKITIIA